MLAGELYNGRDLVEELETVIHDYNAVTHPYFDLIVLSRLFCVCAQLVLPTIVWSVHKKAANSYSQKVGKSSLINVNYYDDSVDQLELSRAHTPARA